MSMYTKQLYPQHEIGRATYGKPNIISWNEETTLKIGSFCSFAERVSIVLGGEHRTDWVTTYPFTALWKSAKHIEGHPKTKGDIVIGNDVWIGMGTTILSGVTIGDGAVIGSESLVISDVAAYTLVGGNPAKTIKKRFSDQIIDELLRIKWWDWDNEKIQKFLPLMLDDNIELFIEKANESCQA